MAPTHTAHVIVNRRVRIPLAELRFSFSRSSGPGGQNVNKVATRVTLLFDTSASAALTPSQRSRLRSTLGRRLRADGVLRLTSSRHRTQAANRRAVIERFAALLADALTPRKPRIKTRVPRAAVARRLEQKARRSRAKRQRQSRPSDDD